MASDINFSNHVKKVNDTMLGMQRILYIGTNYDISKYPVLASQPWRCIYSANQSENLVDFFSREDRQVRLVCSKEAYDASAIKLDKLNPMVICLNVCTEIDGADIDSIEIEMLHDKERAYLQDTLERILKSVLTTELVIVGYDPDNYNEISPKQLVAIAEELGESRVSIYGLSGEKENNKYIQYLEKKGLIKVFNQDLGLEWESFSLAQNAIFEELPREEVHSSTDTQNCVYINGVPTLLEKSLCQDFNRYGRVLTLYEMKINQISRMMQTDYFYRFLKRSPNAPQWYGYSKRNGFAVKREFEEKLYSAVINGIENHSDKPIILAGQTSSGKSIALAALAYRIFQERKYPVLFISNPDITFEKETPAARALDNILKDIRDKGGSAIVIWDCSFYNLQRTNIVRSCSDISKNRGHNMIVVASAMYAENIDKNYFVVNAPVKLTEQERSAFKNLMTDKGRLDRNRVEQWIESYKDDTGLLSMLYRLVYDLHPQLERGMKKELSQALDDTRKELENLNAPVPVEQPVAAWAMKLSELLNKADEEETKEIADEQKTDILNSLQPFSESLAVSSLFKLRMPMTMAMKLLKIPDCENRQEYINAVFNAPWLYCAMDDDKYAPGEYFVSFRDPMDARIYLNGIGMNEQDQMQVVANTIKSIQSEKSSYYEEEVRFLERLIRMVGPNSDDISTKSNWEYTYGAGSLSVIDALAELRKNGIIEPQLIAQEITYIREYYTKKNEVDIQTKIQWLKKALSIAEYTLDLADRNDETTIYWQQGIIDSITVESIFTELRIEERYKEAQEQNLDISISEESVLHSYSQRRNILMGVIESQPENSYAYSALIRSFLSQYDISCIERDTVSMLSDMSDVLSVVDATESSIPAVEQNEYYQRSKSTFLSFFDRVFSDSNRAEKYFEKLLDMRSAVGIHMKARAILRQANVDYNEDLADAFACKACEEALELLENPKYENIVKNHAGCQYLRIQLTWLVRNGQPIFAGERQTTCMNSDDWSKLYEVCRKFKDNIIEKQTDCHYVATVYYIMALACAQLGEYRKAIEVWKEVHEGNIYTSRRQPAWHILCDENGEPKLFKGTFNSPIRLDDRRIFIKELSLPVLYPSLQLINKSSVSGDAPNLCIGTSYRGFSVIAKNHLRGGKK